ncbi:MAG: hypothetical protein IJ973_02115 [Christensenellaceae bacterium]|nr:hypothetical protein [Christensenellaceae bacterium]
MSYCVNCGVELAESEKRCPLCNTIVINRTNPWKEPENFPYSSAVEKPASIDKRFIAVIAALIALIPIATCLIIDLLSGSGITWSFYVIGGIICTYTLGVVPVLLGKNRYIISMFLAFLAISFYLAYINHTTDGHWFSNLGFPIVVCVFVVVFIFLFTNHVSKMAKLYKAALFFSLIGLLCMGIEIIIRRYLDQGMITWSLVVLPPCAIFAIILIVCERKQKIKDEIRKKLYF